jgi:hypothetical protein
MQWSGGTFSNLTWNQSSELKIEHVPNTCRGRVYRLRDIEIITKVQCYIVELRSAEFIDLALEFFYFCICATNQAAQRYFGSLRNCINYCAKIISATCVKWSRILCSKCREGAASFLERVPAKSAPLEWHLLLQNGHMPGPHNEASWKSLNDTVVIIQWILQPFRITQFNLGGFRCRIPGMECLTIWVARLFRIIWCSSKEHCPFLNPCMSWHANG